MFADMLVPDPEDLKSYVLQGHRQVLQLPGATGPKALPHWPTSHFFQLKSGTIWDATVATYEVPSTPQGLGPDFCQFSKATSGHDSLTVGPLGRGPLA